MKSLLLLRHAKSSWKDSELEDHDRPLNRRGMYDAPRMGQLLAELSLLPDLIVTSTARRAISTAQLVSEASGYQGDIECRRALYLAGPQEYLAVLRAVRAERYRVLLIGHNPTMEDVIAALTGRRERMPTAALVHATVNIRAWKDLSERREVTIEGVWRPKEMR